MTSDEALKSSDYAEISSRVFIAATEGLRRLSDPEKILETLRGIVFTELLRRQSDAGFRDQLEEVFGEIKSGLDKKEANAKRDWILKKSEEILTAVLIRRKEIADTQMAPVVQEQIARRAADVVGVDRDVQQLGRGADAPHVVYNTEDDSISLSEAMSKVIVRLISPDPVIPKSCDPKYFSEFIQEAILFRITRVLQFFQKTNAELTRDIGALPFALSEEFMQHLNKVIEEMIFPSMNLIGFKKWTRTKGVEWIFTKRKDWQKIDSSTFWETIDVADREFLNDRWRSAWDHVLRLEPGKSKWSVTASPERQNICAMLGISDVTPTMRMESEFNRTYTAPILDDTGKDFLISLITMDHRQVERMEKELENILAIYQQEFNHVRWFQAQASEGATREAMERVITWAMKEGPFSRYLPDFFTLMVYRVCPQLSTNFIRGIVAGLRNEPTVRIPYTAQFARNRGM